MSAPVVIFAVGNPSRGDDALGPECHGQLEKWLENENLADQFELIEDFQLQIEHALDLHGRQLALFIDAGACTPGPFTFQRIAPATGAAYTTHELPPEAVLQVYVQTEGEEPPPAFVLCIRGETFELGEALSPAAESNLRLAFELLRTLCRKAQLPEWERAAQA
ncbi:hydrogenase maturation protease [Dechloromonas sp.]|uniref:hydrogenase maturation protease n=1 Tax=Dechloromonas sp. TaxID=1917218 RepID=UPI00286DE228|nr:hydrogenase maturation protease [Dechloromonas sp.]